MSFKKLPTSSSKNLNVWEIVLGHSLRMVLISSTSPYRVVHCEVPRAVESYQSSSLYKLDSWTFFAYGPHQFNFTLSGSFHCEVQRAVESYQSSSLYKLDSWTFFAYGPHQFNFTLSGSFHCEVPQKYPGFIRGTLFNIYFAFAAAFAITAW